MTSPQRHALVTGASGGLGTAIAVRLLQDGLRVTLVDKVLPSEADRRRLGVAGSDGERCAEQPILLDLADPAARAALPRLVEPVDVLVNLVAAIDLMIRFGGVMAAAGWGRIVNITSITALAGFPGLTAYAASKAGLLGASVVASAELGMSGVTVNCVAPGAIPTAAEPPGADHAAIIAHQSVSFRGEPSDIASAVAFLAGDEARFVTGQTLAVDGGWRSS